VDVVDLHVEVEVAFCFAPTNRDREGRVRDEWKVIVIQAASVHASTTDQFNALLSLRLNQNVVR
jgi:hypothetical protein